MSPWEWLTVAQHHGLPTRLLDWTYSPLVALHFATDRVESQASDGVVISLDFVRVHQHLPASLRDALEQEGSSALTVEMLVAAADSLQSFDQLGEGQEFLTIFEPPSLDERVVNQYAGLSLMSSVHAMTDAWLEAQDPPLARKIRIPAALKPEVREKLDQANINERMLFPGLDGLTSWLKRYYSIAPRATWPNATA
jgi:hypothetical protein